MNRPEILPLTEKHWRMYYVGCHPTLRQGGMPVHQIGVAESEAGGFTWRRLSPRPAVPRVLEGTYDGFSASSLYCTSYWFGILDVVWRNRPSSLSRKHLPGDLCRRNHLEKFEGNPILRFNPHFRSDALVVTRPQVIRDDGVFRMWYSAKGLAEDGRPGEYRICYAESLDGIHWERFPGNPVLRPSESGWDHKMVEYAEVLRDSDGDHMWFCGDAYGSLGYAKGHAFDDVDSTNAERTRTCPGQ